MKYNCFNFVNTMFPVVLQETFIKCILPNYRSTLIHCCLYISPCC